jgi:hypothetical protein
MKSRRKKPAGRDMLAQLELPHLWPDSNGNLNLGGHIPASSSGLQSLHSPRSPRGEVVRASRLLRSRFLLSWLQSKNWGVTGFGMARRSLFETWLSAQLESCAFGALSLGEVVRSAGADLRLEPGEVIGLLLRATRTGGRFKADGGLITLRG